MTKSEAVKHQLVGGTLKRVDSGIVAQCTCGWSSTHFSSLAASAAFMDHKDQSVVGGIDNDS